MSTLLTTDFREEIHFTVVQSSSDEGPFTYLQFWLDVGLYAEPNWVWDSGKWSLEEALKKYPMETFKWVSIRLDD